jgi:hypothetical protein
MFPQTTKSYSSYSHPLRGCVRFFVCPYGTSHNTAVTPVWRGGTVSDRVLLTGLLLVVLGICWILRIQIALVTVRKSARAEQNFISWFGLPYSTVESLLSRLVRTCFVSRHRGWVVSWDVVFWIATPAEDSLNFSLSQSLQSSAGYALKGKHPFIYHSSKFIGTIELLLYAT